jgi:hypothetical protein
MEHGDPLSVLDKDSVHRIVGVRHTGDTRGNTWYTDVVCVNRFGKLHTQLTPASALMGVE